MEDKTLYPNSFQVNNFYIDKCLHLLDGSEVKVLLYVIRRIIGFNKQFDRISISQFINGITSKSGEVLDSGVGLGRSSIIAALNELKKYGFLLEVEHSNNPKLGNAYTLQFDYGKINLIALEERQLNKGKSTSPKSELVQKVNQSDFHTSPKNKLVDQPKNQQKSVNILVQKVDTQNSVRDKNKNKEKEITEHSSSVGLFEEINSPSQKNPQQSKPKKAPDSRASHPAIIAVREIMNRYPDKLIWDDIIAVLGNNPDLDKLRLCAKAWAKKTTNMGNLDTWLFDWYKNGLPVGEHKQSQPTQSTPETPSTEPTERKSFPTEEELAAMPVNKRRWYEYNKKYFLDVNSPTMQMPVANKYTN